MEGFDATQLAGGSAGGSGEFSITNVGQGQAGACASCGHSGGNSGQPHTMDATSQSASLTSSATTTGTLPGIETMLPEGWTVEEIALLVTALNTAAVVFAAYHSYK